MQVVFCFSGGIWGCGLRLKGRRIHSNTWAFQTLYEEVVPFEVLGLKLGFDSFVGWLVDLKVWWLASGSDREKDAVFLRFPDHRFLWFEVRRKDAQPRPFAWTSTKKTKRQGGAKKQGREIQAVARELNLPESKGSHGRDQQDCLSHQNKWKERQQIPNKTTEWTSCLGKAIAYFLGGSGDFGFSFWLQVSMGRLYLEYRMT